MPSIDEPLLINFKQYDRIIKRREQRNKASIISKFHGNSNKDRRVYIIIIYIVFI